jgi:hypothetical protein
MQSPMRLDIAVPPEVRRGDSVPIVLRLIYDGATQVEVPLQGRPVAFDVKITRPDGALVWRRLEGETVTAILQLRVLPAGDTLVFHGSWDQRDVGGAHLAPGGLIVRGVVAYDPPPGFEVGPVHRCRRESTW